jgi:hypothetical protein
MRTNVNNSGHTRGASRGGAGARGRAKDLIINIPPDFSWGPQTPRLRGNGERRPCSSPAETFPLRLPSLEGAPSRPAARFSPLYCLRQVVPRPPGSSRRPGGNQSSVGDSMLSQKVVPIGNIELNENMEFASPPSTLPSGAQRTSHVAPPRRLPSNLEPHSIWRISPFDTNSQCCVAW